MMTLSERALDMNTRLALNAETPDIVREKALEIRRKLLNQEMPEVQKIVLEASAK